MKKPRYRPRRSGSEGHFIYNTRDIVNQLSSKNEVIRIPCVSYNIGYCEYDPNDNVLYVMYKNAYNSGINIQYEYKGIGADRFLEFIRATHFTRENVISLIGAGRRTYE
jgi:hypothetical protein